LSDNGMQGVVAAIILGVSMIGGAYLVSGSIDRVAAQIPKFESSMKNMQTAMVAGGGAKAPSAPAPTRRGPDPNKVYKLASNGAPTKGPNGAKVMVVEFSDFQ
jgi:hypothetical protein